MCIFANELGILLKWAVRDCVSDSKKPAIFLSGGLDSAVIQAIAKVDNLYCATWEDEDNLSAARLAGYGKEVTPVTFTKSEMLDALPDIVKITGESTTWSNVCQWFLAQTAARDGCDLVMTGEGADEIFGGYSRYRILWHLDKMIADPKLSGYQGFILQILGSKWDVITRLLERYLSQKEARLKASVLPDGPLTKMAATHDKKNLVHLLINERNIIEHHVPRCRFPFTDSHVVKYANSLDEDDKFSDLGNKSILRFTARKLGVSDYIISEETKKGLYIPQSWRPTGEPLWSRKWFDDLVKEVYQKVA